MDLKDQLKAWKEHKRAVGEELRDLKQPSRPKKAPEPEPVAEAPPERELTDEELFLKAVAGVEDGSTAILAKYDRSDDKTRAAAGPGEQPTRPTVDRDRALFLQAVGDMKRTGDDER